MKTQIVYEDKQIIVAYKPAGLAVQTAQVGKIDMECELRNYLRQPFIGVVHRLDQPVEGILVFGKTKEATAILNRQLNADDFCKEYMAAICGKPIHKQAKLVDYLIKEKDVARVCELSEKDNPNVKQAILDYNVIKQNDFFSVLHIQLQTGRFHQIRVQLKNAGFPILGDNKYFTEQSRELSIEKGVSYVALCAYKLQFKHPESGKKMEYEITPKNIAFTLF